MRPLPRLDPSQRAQLTRLQAEAFGAPEDGVGKWWAAAGEDQVHAWPDEGDVQAGLLRIPMGLFVGGRAVPTVGLAGVAVDGAARGRGVGAAMLRDHLSHLDAPLSILYGSTRSFYARVGYGVAGHHQRARVPMDALRAVGRPAPGWWRIDDATWPAVEQAQREITRRGFGLARGPYVWRRIRAPRDVPKQAWAFGPTDDVRAWIVLSQVSQPDTEFFRLVVHDLGAVDADGWDLLRGFVRGQAAMNTELELTFGYRSPLLAALPEFRERVERVEPFLLRVVDVPGALTARGWSDRLHGEVRFAVDDPLLPANRGPWALTVHGGRAEVRPATQGEITLSVSALAGLYTGHATAHDLALLGRAAGPREALDRASALFAGPTPGLSEFF